MTETAPLRLVIADDQELVRAGFRLILERAGMQVAAEASNGEEAIAHTLAEEPDVALMDIRMPVLDGIEATQAITASASRARVLALTTFDLDEYVYEVVRAGAAGFLLKDAPPDDLVHAVRVVARGESLLAPAVTARLLQRFTAPVQPSVEFTEREGEIVRLVARGLSNAEIGSELYLSAATVKTYVSRLLTRLNLRDRVQLAVLAYETGLVLPRRGPASPGSVSAPRG